MDKMPFSINVLYGAVFIENTSDLSGGEKTQIMLISILIWTR